MRSMSGGAVLLLAACALAACAAVAHGAVALQLGVINSASGALTDWNDTVKGEPLHAWAQRVHLSRCARQAWPLRWCCTPCSHAHEQGASLLCSTCSRRTPTAFQ